MHGFYIISLILGLTLNFFIPAANGVQLRLKTGNHHPKNQPQFVTRSSPWGSQPKVQDQCPCVKPAGSDSCIAYNPLYQAATLEEAVVNFYDMSSADPLTAKTMNPVQNATKHLAPQSSRIDCQDNACRDCVRFIAQWASRNANFGTGGGGGGGSGFGGGGGAGGRLRLHPREHAIKTDDDKDDDDDDGDDDKEQYRSNEYFSEFFWTKMELENLERSAGIAKPNQTQFSAPPSCISLSFVKMPPASPTSTWAPPSRYLNGPISHRGKRLSIGEQLSTSSVPPTTPTTSNTVTESAVEQVWNVSCISKGTPIEDDTEWMGMCDLCWTWIILKPNYFPRYVNQLSCGPDSRCLSGHGSCRPRYRSLAVQKKSTVANSGWEEHLISISMGCDCQLRRDSDFANFVRN